MAHILLLIEAPCAVLEPRNEIEKLISSIDKRKYPLKKHREGHCAIQISRMETYNIRIKEEAVGPLLQDLGTIILNPANNKIRLIDVIKCRDDSPSWQKSTIGRAFMLLRWGFKIFNKLRINKLFGIYPIEINEKRKAERFNTPWHYSFSYGYHKDENDLL